MKRLDADRRREKQKTVYSLQEAVDTKEKENIKLFSHRFSQINTEVKGKRKK